MNAKQNAIFFFGVVLIIMVFWVNGYWAILKGGISGGKSAPPPSASKIVRPSNGKCPPGYTKLDANLCFPSTPVGGIHYG